MQNKNEQLIFKRKKIKEEVSLPHLYPSPPKGRGRIWKEPHLYPPPPTEGGGGLRRGRG